MSNNSFSHINPISYYTKELNKFKDDGKVWVQSGICPFHNDKKPGNLSINRINGAYTCHRCGARGGSLIKFHSEKYAISFMQAACELNLDPPRENIERESIFKNEKPVNVNKLKSLELLLKQSIPLKDEKSKLALTYFKNRGLTLNGLELPENIFFHPRSSNYNDGAKTYHPCLIAKVTNLNGLLLTAQKTYINADGYKLRTTHPKKFVPSIGRTVKGGSVKMYCVKNLNTLGICEGVETALAIKQITGIPVWACMTAQMLKDVEIPTHIKNVKIYADNDLSQTGQNSAIELHRKLTLKGINVVIIMPPLINKKSTDWLDFLIENQKRAEVLL